MPFLACQIRCKPPASRAARSICCDTRLSPIRMCRNTFAGAEPRSLLAIIVVSTFLSRATHMDVAIIRQAALPANLGQFIVQATQESQFGLHIESSFQEATEKGHRIQIRTQFEIRLDGRRWRVPIGIDNVGNLYCAVLPHQQFRSLLDVVKALTEQFCVTVSPRTAMNKPHDRRRQHATRNSSSSNCSEV